MTKAKSTSLTPAPKETDRLSQAQRNRAADVAKAVLDAPAAPPMTLTANGNDVQLGFDGVGIETAVLLQMADIGTIDQDFHIGLVRQIIGLGSQKKSADAANANFVFSVVRAVQPRDELEALLAAQMGAVHAATMMMARRLNLSESITQQDSAERAMNKLARTFATQMEALKRYRTSGQQKVTVEHVTVNAGGQAIVGAVEAGGGGRK